MQALAPNLPQRLDRCPSPAPGHLRGEASTFRVFARVPCRSWSCDRCGNIKALKLRLRVEMSTYNKFLTLTHRPVPGEGPEAALDRMRRNWTKLSKRIQRRNGGQRIKYVAVTEWTKKGWPHLHLLADMPYLPQRVLSGHWKALHGSPIVDIRRVKSEDGAARYLAKYLTKGTYMPKKKRRYTASRGFLPQLPPYENPNYDEQPKWGYGKSPLDEILETAKRNGHQIIECQPDCYIIIPERPRGAAELPAADPEDPPPD